MTSDDIFTAVRSFYFVWSFALFMGLIYWGLQDILLSRKCGHVQVSPEHYLFATATLAGAITLAGSLGELFLVSKIGEGGVRVFLPIIFLVPASIALHQGAFRIRQHRKSIAKGWCS